jgi:antitoxin HicB
MNPYTGSDFDEFLQTEQLQTSRSQIDRLLDPDYTALTLDSLERLAHVLGKQLRIELA